MVLVLLGLFCAALSYNANAETASGTGYGGLVNLNVANIGLINQGPLPPGATGSGSNSFGPIHDETTSLSVPLPLLGGVSSSVLTGDVSYDNPAHLMFAAGGVANPNVGLNVLGLLGVLLTADAVESTSTVSGTCGNLTAAGSAELANAVLRIGTTDIPLPINPAPNTGIDGADFGLAGLTLLLNEQSVTGNGTTTRAITTNALRLTLNLSVGGLSVVAGDIVFGHSDASVQCNNANLAITKTDSPDPVVVNQVLNYTLTVTNNGPDAATSAVITDTLPSNVTVNSITPSNGGACNQTGNVVRCNWASIPASTTRQAVIAVVPSQAGIITNGAVVGQDDFDSVAGNNSASITTTVNEPPALPADLSVTKTASPSPVTLGQPLIYTLSVSNAGPNPASNIVLTDNLAPGLPAPTVTQGPFTCSVSGSTVTCTLATLAVGATASATIQIVPQSAGVITNVANVSSNSADSLPSNNSVTISTQVNAVGPTPAANLSVTKSANPNPVTAGQPLTYTLTVANAGPDAATNVTLVDNLPPGLAVTSITQGSFTCSQSGATITCSLASLASGASAQVTIQTLPSTAGVLANSATVGSAVHDPSTANNGVSISTTVNPVTSENANLSVTKAASPSPVTAGQPLTYTLTVANAGPQAASNVTLTDNLPAGLQVTNISSASFTCNQANTVVSCNLASLAVGASATVVIQTLTSTAGTLTNSATVGSGANDPTPGNNSATTTTTVNPSTAGSANLSLTKTADPNPAMVGQPVTYTLTVSNSGPNPASNIVLVDNLPPGLTAVITAGPFTCSQAGSVVTCNLASLAVGASASVNLQVTPASAGVLNNSATVGSAVNDPNSGDNTITIGIIVNDPTDPGNAANLSVTKTASPSTVNVGQTLTYTLTVTNAGPHAAPNVVLTDNLPSGVQVIGFTPGPFTCNLAGSTLNCTLANQAAGASALVTVQIVPQTAGVVTNSASVASSATDSDTQNNTTSISTVVNAGSGGPSANLSVTKTASSSAVTTGETLTYTLTVSNAGPAAATNITLVDNLPSGVQVTSLTPGPFACSQGATVISCSLASLASGASAQVVIQTVVLGTGNLTNSATVGSGVNDPITSNNTASVTTQAGGDRETIPTLSEWGLLLLMGIMLLFGYRLHPSRE